MALFARGTSIFVITNRNYVKTVSLNKKSVTWRKFPSQFAFWEHYICRECSSSPDITNKDGLVEFKTFDRFISERRKEARRSVLVEVNSEKSIPYLHNYCSKFGNVMSMYFYSLSNQSHQVLVEFKDRSVVRTVFNSATLNNFNEIIPAKNVVFYFRNGKVKQKYLQREKIPLLQNRQMPKDSQLINHLRNSKTASEQIEKCYSLLKLDDLGVRLRFHTSYQIERCFTGIFPSIQVLPFGSTVNGFGKLGCDLDLYLNLSANREEDSNNSLIFQTKFLKGDYRKSTELLRIIGEMLENAIPGIDSVLKILHARVPIIKFNNKYTGVECDLSLSNMSAVYMSELLYLYGEMDSRVRPIVFTIKKWAKIKGLTSEHPGSCITNFSLTLLILFYLQQKNILPTLQELKKKATRSDKRITDSNVDCTFVRDISEYRKQISSTEDSFTLLKGFFEYYATFHYKNQGICLLRGSQINKKDNTPLLIHNPLEPNLNVSKNVSFKEIDRIRYFCREAFWNLETTPNDPSLVSNWGILTLFQNNSQKSKNTNSENNIRIEEYFNVKSIPEEQNLLFVSN